MNLANCALVMGYFDIQYFSVGMVSVTPLSFVFIVPRPPGISTQSKGAGISERLVGFAGAGLGGVGAGGAVDEEFATNNCATLAGSKMPSMKSFGNCCV